MDVIQHESHILPILTGDFIDFECEPDCWQTQGITESGRLPDQ
ncbi:hypothetical protein LCGC14_2906010, partial [marine sediment metagenome]